MTQSTIIIADGESKMKDMYASKPIEDLKTKVSFALHNDCKAIPTLLYSRRTKKEKNHEMFGI